MSDTSFKDGFHQFRRVNRVEFHIYHSLILCLALGPHGVSWLVQLLLGGRMPDRSPLARALRDARSITPMIFRG